MTEHQKRREYHSHFSLKDERLINNEFGITDKRFLRRIEINENGCWLWKGADDGTDGYGRYWYTSTKHMSAHKYAYILVHGPVTQQVLHTCDVKKCCYPGHLFEGTQADNVHDAMRKGIFYTKPKLLNDIAIDTIYFLWRRRKVSRKRLAAAYNINYDTLCGYIRQKRREEKTLDRSR